MTNRTPASSFGLLVKSKTFVVACLLSSAAMITEPQVAHARNGMNGFVAGAILGGAMRGLGTPRTYRGSRTYSTRRSGSSSRSSRSRNSKPEKEIEAKDSGGEKVFGTSQVPATAAGGAAGGAAGATVTGASASGGSTAAAASPSSGSAESAGSGSRSSSRSGRSGGLQTIKDGLD